MGFLRYQSGFQVLGDLGPKTTLFLNQPVCFRFFHTVRGYVKGVGAPDGELDLFELYTFFSVISIMVALALRIHVNTATDYPEIIKELSSDNSTSSMPLCSQFSVAAASLTEIGQLASISENFSCVYL